MINGKFAAGLVMISIALVAMTLLDRRVRDVPARDRPGLQRRSSGSSIWVLITIVYVAFWLALGTLLSVIFRRAATAALVGFGLWLVVTIFGGLITSLVGGLSPRRRAPRPSMQALSAAQLQQFITRLLPSTLYREARSWSSTRR